MLNSPLRISLIYVTAGAAWILLTDWLLHLIALDPAVIARLSTLKGWAFIAVTALILHRIISRDHAEIGRSNAVIREREELLRNVLDTIPVGVWLLDREGNISYGNPSGQDIWEGKLLVGIDRFDEYKGWWLASGERISAGEWAGTRAIRQGEMSIGEEIEIETFTGYRKIILHSAVPLRNRYDDIVGAIVVNEDISSRKRMENILREQERIYRELFENNPQPMWVYAVETMAFLAVNDAAVDHYGYSRQEFLRMTLKDIRHPENVAALTASVGSARDRFTHVGVWQHRKKNGVIIEVELTTHDLLFNESKARLVLINDITERLRVERENAAYQERLRFMASEMSLIEERERRKLATALHDGIGQVLALAKIRLGGVKESYSASDCRQLTDEVRQLLEQAIASSRSLTFELSPPVLHELGFESALRSLCENFQEQHGLRIEYLVDREPTPLVEDMRILLFRSVQELLVNIVKHAGAGNVRVSCRRNAGSMLVTVVDDGRGFDPAVGGAQSPDGIGFGLFSIRERLHHLGGEMTIDSVRDRGTAVTLAVPLQDSAKEGILP